MMHICTTFVSSIHRRQAPCISRHGAILKMIEFAEVSKGKTAQDSAPELSCSLRLCIPVHCQKAAAEGEPAIGEIGVGVGSEGAISSTPII